MTPSNRPRVAVFTLGGTIASVPGEGDTERGVSPRLTAADLIASAPGVADVADIETIPFRQVPSVELTLADIVELQRAIRGRLAAGCAGAVVVQGTDTLEETAFTLDVLIGVDEPVVVTGAMRSAGVPGADGPANLLGAVQVAASAECLGLGCLVVFSDQIHSGRYVRKTHTTSLSTFRSPTTGPLGWIGETGPQIALRPAHRRWLDARLLREIPAVAMVTVGLGDDGRLLGGIAEYGYRGLVVEATGAGHVPAVVADRLGPLAEAMPVVLASRTGAGEVLRETYGFPGSERDLHARGLISAGMLDGAKARVLLALALAAGAERDGVAHVFRAIGATAVELPDGLVGL